MNYYGKTRLKRRSEKEAKKQIAVFIFGIIIIFFLIIKFGFSAATSVVQLIINFNEKTSPNYSGQNNKIEILTPPLLNSLTSATNSAVIDISGKSITNDGDVELFINNDLKAETNIDKNGDFIFENVNLNEGENSIKARFKTNENKLSDFSKEDSIILIKKSPDLDITFPQTNTIFSQGNQDVNVSGKTNPDNKVIVNGFWAIMQNDGSFSYTLRLNDGDNTIKIESQDIAGNKTTKEITVKYQP